MQFICVSLCIVNRLLLLSHCDLYMMYINTYVRYMGISPSRHIDWLHFCITSISSIELGGTETRPTSMKDIPPHTLDWRASPLPWRTFFRHFIYANDGIVPQNDHGSFLLFICSYISIFHRKIGIAGDQF
jgi:hypothetical protein